MKKILDTFLLLFLSIIFSCNPVEKKVTISVSMDGYKDSNPVIYAFSKSGGSGELADTILPDANGDFNIERMTDGPMWFYFYIDKADPCFYFRRILVKSGEKHQISCNTTMDYKDTAAIEIHGPNSDGQLLYYSMDNSLRGTIGGKSIFSEQWSINNPESLIDSLNQKVERGIKPANSQTHASRSSLFG